VTVNEFPSLNHLFLPAKTGDMAEYSSLPSSRIPDDVLRILGDCLATHLVYTRGRGVNVGSRQRQGSPGPRHGANPLRERAVSSGSSSQHPRTWFGAM
jgi:hypothetical protein